MDWLAPDTWVTSDHHFGHANIQRLQGRPDDHEERMEALWRERVGEDEPVLHLGDVVYANKGRFDELALRGYQRMLRSLPGRKFLILGNHDKLPPEWYERAGFEVLGRGDKPLLATADPDHGLVYLTHEPLTSAHHDYPYLDDAFDVNVHGHIHGNPLWGPLPRRRYANACVEVTGYAPVRLRDLLAGATEIAPAAGP
jgi:calcineurin-like phosphoesterase family protein